MPRLTITSRHAAARIFGTVLELGHSVTLEVEDERVRELQLLVNHGEIECTGLTKEEPAVAPAAEMTPAAPSAPAGDFEPAAAKDRMA